MIPLGRFDCSTGVTSVLKARGDLLVRTSSPVDVSYVDHLQRKEAHAVGFIQRTIWDRYVFGGERSFVVMVCEKNGDRVGYLLLTPGRTPMSYAKIQQIAVQQDARRLEYGTLLIDAVRDFCEQFCRLGVTLRCRVDLESNHFWRALGFHCYGIWSKGTKNHVGMTASNDILLWRIDLNRNAPRLELESGHEKPTLA